MKKYVVIVSFVDLQDNDYRYRVGDEFPRKGIEVSAERIEELLTDKNRRHKPMIEDVKVDKASAVTDDVADVETIATDEPEVNTEAISEEKAEEKAEEITPEPVKKGRKKKNAE